MRIPVAILHYIFSAEKCLTVFYDFDGEKCRKILPGGKKDVELQQHTYLASRQISALKVSLFFYIIMKEYTKKPLPYGMKSYLQPMMYDKQTHTYKQGATFEQAYELYKFDSRLRKLIIAEIEKIEVSVRSQMASISTEEKGAFGFADKRNFNNEKVHSDVLEAIHSELDRSDDEFVLSFRSNYTNQFPPAWISLEVTSEF